MTERDEIRAERIALRRREMEAARAAKLEARRSAQAAEREARVSEKEQRDADILRRKILAPVPEVDGLPRVLLIGDSISMGYTLRVREILEEANVQRIPQNGGTSAAGIVKLADWLRVGVDKPWDVIHFNFGIHDLVHNDAGVAAATPQQHGDNLRVIVAALKETGARLIFATTTPTPVGSRYDNAADYNAVAVPIMQENDVPVNDLYAAVLPHFDEYATPNNPHFKPIGYHFLASRVTDKISEWL